MSYDHQKIDLQLGTALSLANADPISGPRAGFFQPAQIDTLWALITTAVSTAAVTLTFKYRPTPGNASGEVVIGTMVLPLSTAAGKLCYKKIIPVKIPFGAELVVTASGGGAGNAHIGVGYTPSWDNPVGNANTVLSV